MCVPEWTVFLLLKKAGSLQMLLLPLLTTQTYYVGRKTVLATGFPGLILGNTHVAAFSSVGWERLSSVLDFGLPSESVIVR